MINKYSRQPTTSYIHVCLLIKLSVADQTIDNRRFTRLSQSLISENVFCFNISNIFTTFNFIIGGKYVVCYYGSWGMFRPTPGTHVIEYINPNLCTHLIYTFAGLDLDGEMVSLNPSFDIDQEGYIQFNKLKEVNPCLKTLLAIGGWAEGSEKYSIVRFANDKLVV